MPIPTIWKYPLQSPEQLAYGDVPSTVELRLPYGGNIISAGLDPLGALCVWAEVSGQEKGPYENCRVFIVGTGNPLPNAGHLCRPLFLGTVLQKPFVWHVYLLKE